MTFFADFAIHVSSTASAAVSRPDDARALSRAPWSVTAPVAAQTEIS